jgi:hypothetical protein
MATINLLPYDPVSVLAARMESVLVSGIPGVASITPSGQPAWADVTGPCPAGHYLFPAGWRIYTDREPEAKVQAPCVLIAFPDDGKQRHEVLSGFWQVMVHCRLLVRRAADMAEAETVLRRMLLVLTEPVTLDAGGQQTAQARLSSAALHVHGSTRQDNFPETVAGSIKETEDLPEREFVTNVICGLIG